MKKYIVHYSGYYGYDVEVVAENEAEAEIEADAIFDEVDPSDFWFEPSPVDIYMEI